LGTVRTAELLVQAISDKSPLALVIGAIRDCRSPDGMIEREHQPKRVPQRGGDKLEADLALNVWCKNAKPLCKLFSLR
jgi:hypothetical protein